MVMYCSPPKANCIYALVRELAVNILSFKDKRKHLAKVHIPNITYPNQYIDLEIPHVSRDRVLVQIL